MNCKEPPFENRDTPSESLRQSSCFIALGAQGVAIFAPRKSSAQFQGIQNEHIETLQKSWNAGCSQQLFERKAGLCGADEMSHSHDRHSAQVIAAY
eukprot:4988474-Amphidinium_carterae.1